MAKRLTVLNVGITLYCLYSLGMILFSPAGGWGNLVIWIFPVTWLIGIGIDEFLKAVFNDRIYVNIAGAVLLAFFLFLVVK